MRYLFVALLITVCLAGEVLGQSLSITGPRRNALLEKETYNITWSAEGLKSVSIVAHGERTPLGGRSRGDFHIVVANGVPAEDGRVSWEVPWIDAVAVYVKAKGYDDQGRQVAVDESGYGFRPAVMAKRSATGLYLDLHERTNQKLYVQRDGKIVKAYLSSSSENYIWRPPGRHMQTPHDHAGVFTIRQKTRNHWSSMFNVWMPYAMRYHGGHFIHATSPNLYRYLGGTASHGCNRLTREDARELYTETRIGARVEVIGPEG